MSSYCPLIWSHRKPFSLHSRQGGLCLTMLLTSPQHSNFKEDLLKAQGFPELVRQCQTSMLSHHIQRLSLAADLVFKKSVSHCQQRYSESRPFNFLAHNYGRHEKILCRSLSCISFMKTVSQTTQLGFACVCAEHHLAHLCLRKQSYISVNNFIPCW